MFGKLNDKMPVREEGKALLGGLSLVEMKHIEGTEYEPSEKSLLGIVSRSFKTLRERR